MANKKAVSIAATSILAAAALSGCANDNARYRADVYGAGSLNQAIAVQTVEILAVQPAKVALPNSRKNSAAQLAGTVGGAIAGAVIGNQFGHNPWQRSDGRVVGAVAGGVIGNRVGNLAAGDTDYEEGVQITFRNGDQIFTSVQVGSLCEYKLGSAVMMQEGPNGSRIQPNNAGGCAQQAQ